MGRNELTKAEARNLITPVVDDEVSEQERRAFMDFIAKHDDVRREYESIKRIKSLMCTRCPCAKAPTSLRQYVKTLGEGNNFFEEQDIPIYDMPCDGSVSQQECSETPEKKTFSLNRPFLVSIAATLLVAVSVWGFFSFNGSLADNPVYSVEKYAYEHFIKHDGQFVPPTISTASLGSAETQLAQNYDMPMKVPVLENAEFKGIIYKEFVPDYKAPMLEYYLPSEDQYIYIFAFELDKMKKFGQLVRHNEAVKKCNKPKDFYTHTINGKDVVSWKWDNVWYTAVSNHKGDVLASRVKPMDYSLSDNTDN